MKMKRTTTMRKGVKMTRRKREMPNGGRYVVLSYIIVVSAILNILLLSYRA